jgi:polyisoprenyl-teichoic acid--peptidoglycan teichoic acid transferase
VLTAGAAVSALCLLGACVVGYALAEWNSVDRIDLDTDAAEAGEPLNILVVGSDSRAGESPGEAAEVTGKRTDTIMVVRLDPASEHVAVLSFPRDLWLPIADTGEPARINSAYSESGEQQVLIDTIRQNFGITINHWIEVDFQGFRDLVDALGGVTLYFDHALRDRASGLYVTDLGCVTLDGDMALAYARSRKAEYLTDDGWEDDPQSDLSRITRQQTLMREALREALDQVDNPLRLRELVAVGTDNVSIDRGLGLSDIRRLADRFSEIDPENFQTASLPVQPRPGDELATVVVDERAAEPVLNVFRGLDPGEVSPSLVEVSVRNGTVADPARQRDGLAGAVSDELADLGFEVTPPGDDAEFHEHTTVRYAPGEATYGQRVARHITGGVFLEEDPALDHGEVTVVVGADFTSTHAEATPIDELPPPPGGSSGAGSSTAGSSTSGSSTTVTSGDTSATTLPTGSTTTTPAQVGAVPEGAC